MGVFVHLMKSQAVTQEEWDEVYKESLKLVKGLNLGEVREIRIHDAEFYALEKVEERTEKDYSGDIVTGWNAHGSYKYLTCCEDNGLYRDINYTVNENAKDPLYIYLKGTDEEKLSESFPGKTQGQPQYLDLLAIACMAVDKLGNKAFILGDVNRGQMLEAVRRANEILDHKIRVPDCLDLQRFYDRINQFPCSEEEKFEFFTETHFGYQGIKNAEYGEFVRNHFSSEIINDYWRYVFDYDSFGYNYAFHDYFTYGFDLADLCHMVPLKDKQGNDHTKDFIKGILDTEMYIKHKDTQDPQDIINDDPTPYDVNGMLWRRFIGGDHNNRVDRYMSLDEIRNTLNNELGDVNDLIDQVLIEKELNKKEHYADQLLESFRNRQFEKYDIKSFYSLLFYEHGDRIAPEMLKQIFEFHSVCQSIVRDDQSAWNHQSLEEKIKWLARRSSSVVLRESDWQMILDCLEKNPSSAARYLSATNVRINSQPVLKMVQSYMINDDFYYDLIHNQIIDTTLDD